MLVRFVGFGYQAAFAEDLVHGGIPEKLTKICLFDKN
jgi:hypothetical protein